jgi:transcriptional regulator of acetoin/glycerol metabolism
VKPEDLPFVSLPGPANEAQLQAELSNDEGGYYAARDRLLATFDRTFLTRVILRAGGNLSKAARLAGIDRTTFYRLMERHGLRRNGATGPEELD